MKQVININFQGRVVPIEVSAFELLKNYTESLSRYFANEEGKEEIINDIESRIGELFQERIKAGSTCITDEDVNAIIKSMGRPEEFEEAEEGNASNKSNSSAAADSAQANQGAGTTATHKRLYRNENDKVIGGVCSGLANYFKIDPIVMRVIFVLVSLAFGTGILAYIILWVAVPSSATAEIGGTRKKLFRDPDDKIIAGIGSGIGNYFGVSPWLPRVLFLLPFLTFVFRFGHVNDFPDFLRVSFSPGALILYIILWLVLPEAATTTEKLEMKGEKVDLNSIKHSVMEEMKGVQQRTEKFGKEAKTFAEEKGKVMGAEIATATKRNAGVLGNLIVLIVKIIGYFILGCVGFGLVVSLFGIAIFSIGVFPLKDFILTDGWQNVFAWGTLIFFIAVPVIGIITWLIRRLAKMKSNRKALRFSFVGLWFFGWFCFIALIASVARDFKTFNTINEEEIVLNNPTVNKLELTTISPMQKFYRNNWFKLQPFEALEEDTAYVKNIEVRIVRSPNDSFKVTMLKTVRGRNKRFADTLASLIHFGGEQKDSLLILDKGIAINRKDKFRNQRVIITVAVPLGKQIKINRSVGWSQNIHFDGPWNDDDFNIEMDDEQQNGWEPNVDYVMKADGLYTLDGKPADKWKHKDEDNDEDGRVSINKDTIEVKDATGRKVTIDGNHLKIEDGNSQQVLNMDSIKKSQQEEKQRVKDSLQKIKENIEGQLKKVTGHSSQGILNYYQVEMYSPMESI